MTVHSTAPAATAATSHGRAYLWAAIGILLLGVGLTALQYILGHLFVPWHLPALTTLAAVLVVVSLARRRSVTRIITLVLLAAVAGLGWFLSFSKLPVYDGPRPGQQVPPFQTTRANGQPFADNDLRAGQTHVIVFFRGRW